LFFCSDKIRIMYKHIWQNDKQKYIWIKINYKQKLICMFFSAYTIGWSVILEICFAIIVMSSARLFVKQSVRPYETLPFLAEFQKKPLSPKIGRNFRSKLVDLSWYGQNSEILAKIRQLLARKFDQCLSEIQLCGLRLKFDQNWPNKNYWVHTSHREKNLL
jgi:hypothetical protein